MAWYQKKHLIHLQPVQGMSTGRRGRSWDLVCFFICSSSSGPPAYPERCGSAPKIRVLVHGGYISRGELVARFYRLFVDQSAHQSVITQQHIDI